MNYVGIDHHRQYSHVTPPGRWGLTLSLANGSTPGAGTFPGLTLSPANGSTPGAGAFSGLTLSLANGSRTITTGSSKYFA